MHRKSRRGETLNRQPLTHRAGAIAGLALTPVVGYALGRIAWEQAHTVATSVSAGSLGGTSSLTLGQAIAPLAATVGMLIAAHLTWTTLVMLVAPRQSRVRAAVVALTPTAWRRLVAVATTGTLSIALAVPATAGMHSSASEVPDAGWVAAPASATAPEPSENAEPASASALSTASALQSEPAPAESTESRTVVVAPGDTLWDITAAQLDLPASDHGAIAAAWPELYEENRDTIGVDPGRIEPNQQLTIPQGWTA